MSFHELSEIYSDLFNKLEFRSQDHNQKMIVALLIEFSVKIAPKVQFKTEKNIKFSITVAQACAIVIFVGLRDVKEYNFLETAYLRLSNNLQKQLA